MFFFRSERVLAGGFFFTGFFYRVLIPGVLVFTFERFAVRVPGDGRQSGADFRRRHQDVATEPRRLARRRLARRRRHRRVQGLAQTKKTSKPFSAATLDPFMFAFIDFFPLPIVLLVSLMDYSPFCFIVFFLVYIYSLVY